MSQGMCIGGATVQFSCNAGLILQDTRLEVEGTLTEQERERKRGREGGREREAERENEWVFPVVHMQVEVI